jgi:hypothetical protein
MFIQRSAVIFASTIALGACRPAETTTFPAFYHWRTHLALSDTLHRYLDSLGVARLYVKFFDVDWEEGRGPVPAASLRVSGEQAFNGEIVPCVFIANRVLERLDADSIPMLAKRLTRYLDRLTEQFSKRDWREWQLDCDWTLSTRDKYFQLLHDLGDRLRSRNLALSATIRLHQVRYFERTGVPPVDRGMLMFYNMGDLEDWHEDNSILQLEKAQPYLHGFNRYPLPLDLALPAYAWGVLFRDGRMIRLIHGLRAPALDQAPHFVKSGPNRYRVVKSHYLEGQYFYQGDQVRLENIDPPALRAASDMLRRHFRGRQFFLAFYHLEDTTPKQYPHARMAPIIRNF